MLVSLISAPAVARQVVRVVGRRRAGGVQPVRRASNLMRELQFDLLDLVNIILELESRFHITIPDEVPLVTVGDLVDYVRAEIRHSLRS